MVVEALGCPNTFFGGRQFLWFPVAGHVRLNSRFRRISLIADSVDSTWLNSAQHLQFDDGISIGRVHFRPFVQVFLEVEGLVVLSILRAPCWLELICISAMITVFLGGSHYHYLNCSLRLPLCANRLLFDGCLISSSPGCHSFYTRICWYVPTSTK